MTEMKLLSSLEWLAFNYNYIIDVNQVRRIMIILQAAILRI